MLPVPPRNEPELSGATITEELSKPVPQRAAQKSFGRVGAFLIVLTPGLVILSWLINPLTGLVAVFALPVAVRVGVLLARQGRTGASARTEVPDAPEPSTPHSTPVPTKAVRPRSVIAAVFALALLTYGAWAYFRAPPGDPPETGDVHSVRVWAAPWRDEQGFAPDADTNDPETIEALLAIVRSARETQDHKCGHCGVIVLRRSFGRVERLAYLPGHYPEWYEFRHGRKIYRVPRTEFVAAMKRLGVEVPTPPD